jgi:hypothetical protein
MPTALKLLRGNPGKQRLPANEPQTEFGLTPAARTHISAGAGDSWQSKFAGLLAG